MTLVFNTGSSARARMEAAGRAFDQQRMKAKRESAAAEFAIGRAAVDAARERDMAARANVSARLLYERPCMTRVLIEVADKHRLQPRDILARSNRVPVVKARQECFWRCRTELGRSFPHIGRFFDRDHSTVIHGVRHHQERIEAGEA